ncbi:SusD/RagB family nutrient-binding outer membrane lipoprotein [Tenacibaculum xiamenense]|uniref:SusD/RagB family nutrient-binding outer membrane lipoprotein n=1 Tax=Tenacibaculum xiamenense TaxID=1261553 RepID=UPI00389438AB
MKVIKNKVLLLLGALFLFSCSDFEEINVDPLAASEDQVQVEYFINRSIGGAQQNPHIAERVFVLYWKAAGRMDRINSLPVGYSSDSWSSDYYNGYVSTWLKDVTNAVIIADKHISSGKGKAYTNNLKQIARIWRAYIMSEMTDNFGPIPVEGFEGENPEYNSVKEVYYHMLEELKEATNAIDESEPTKPNSNLDPAFGYDYSKWKKYGNSLRMRLAMRLSEVDETKARQEFEEAVTGGYIATLGENFQVQEDGGWNDFTGVMTREWNMQYLSPTLNNLMIGLGGVRSVDQLSADKHGYIKPSDYMGVKYENHFTEYTNNPSKGFWFDGLYDAIDPRAYANFAIPGDFDNPQFNSYPSWNIGQTHNTVRSLLNDDGTVLEDIDGAFTWNTFSIGSWGDTGAKNRLRYPSTTPRLVNKYRQGENKRVFFASWESYFLIAEAAVRGWNVPMSGKDAYEKGIIESFTYTDVSQYAGAYISSTSYNRAGTSVSWTHTAEPPATVTMNYTDGYTNVAGTFDFRYPVNTIYRNGTVKNDLLNKIITQKFIAQTPWLPLETWSDHRRLGLPFFENPAVEDPLTNLPTLTRSNYLTNQVGFFPQRLKYPSSFENNVPNGYSQAVGLLGGEDSVFTPLWWAKQN